MSEPVATKEAGPPPDTITEEKKADSPKEKEEGGQKKQREYKEFGGEEQETVREFLLFFSVRRARPCLSRAFGLSAESAVCPSDALRLQKTLITPSILSHRFTNFFIMLIIVFISQMQK
jgi:hypothetical protein